MERDSSCRSSSTVSDLYFLIAKFLAGGPCSDIAEALRNELERRKILPPRLDWQGYEHEQSFEELEAKFQHLGANHLLDVCERLGPLMAEKQSMSSTNWSLLHPLRNRISSVCKYSAQYRGLSFQDPVQQNITHNVVKLVQGRENISRINPSNVLTPKFYTRLQLLSKTLGHLSSVYCVLFDKTGRYVFTGADDLLVKVWSVHTGRLLATLRGASSEITDIDVNPENTLLAAGSCDKILRVWCLQTAAPVAVLSSHTGMITSVNFCPYSSQHFNSMPTRYLVSTSTDGSVAFWSYEHRNISKLVKFQSKPIQYHERMRPGQAQMICAGFSPGGAFLAAGSADHHVRVYHMAGEEGPTRILEKEAHSDRVDSIQWSTSGLRFISGSKDGTALIWRFEAGDWHSVTLNMYSKLPGAETSEEDTKQRLKVSMVAWAMNDQWVITAVNDYTLKVWDSKSGALCHVMTGHKDEVFVLEPHPLSPALLLSASHDGQIIFWDILKGSQVRSYVNTVDGQGHGAVFDAKWSPDGTMAAATDSHGHLLLFGLGTNEKYRNLPKQLFFHTDYRPLIRDANHWVLDEQTQIAPHLMPPPFLVDVDGNPYPPELQRLVPGRENCREEQLVPNIIITDDGDQEVIEGLPENEQVQAIAAPVNPGVVPPPNPAQAAAAAALARVARLNSIDAPVHPARSNIDQMIEALARAGPSQPVQPGEQRPGPSAQAQARQPRAAPQQPRNNANVVGLRLSGDVEGIRQTRGNWQGTNEVRFTKKTLIPLSIQTTLDATKAKNIALGKSELSYYYSERCKLPVKQTVSPQVQKRAVQKRVAKRPVNRTRIEPNPIQMHNYRLRFAGGSGVPDELFNDVSPSSSEEDGEEGSVVISSSEASDSSDDSSDYSDWVADTGANLEPPKRYRRKPVISAKVKSSQDDQSDEEFEPVAGPSNEAGPSTSTAVPCRRDSRLRQAPKKTKRADPSPSPPSLGVNVTKILGPKKELPEAYRPSEWLSEVIPRKAPYYPQMGDEVMYFRQGHQQYLNAVRAKKLFELGPRCEPWLKRKDIRDQELVKVIGIKYEIRPPRLCCLKLALLNSSTNAITSTFTIKYHDMPDVLDFLVLKQTYDTAMSRNWKPGDQFRCMIDDSWWIGTIESHEPFEPEFPDSAFQCFQVRWDNGEYEKMSPWDLEPIDPDRLPAEVGGSVPILPSEIQATLYQSKPEEWPPAGDRDEECQRILDGIEQVMTLSAAEPFAAPVDLNQYPSYAIIVEYPIDLTMIRSRLENHFYRRVTSVQYDVRFIATNAEKFNQKDSNIVKQARIVTELCLEIIKNPQSVAVSGMYHSMMDNYKSDSESTEEEASDGSDKGKKNRNTNNRRYTRKVNQKKAVKSTRSRPANEPFDPNAWKIRCRDLLDVLWSCQDSQPFRQPVDLLEHPDYIQLIDTPMDLGTVREELLCGNYESPLEFTKDVRLIFSNSKNFNTNKNSRIFGMTIRLSMLFETRMGSILDEWKQAKRRASSANVKKPVRRVTAMVAKTRAVRSAPAKPKPAVPSSSSASSSSSSSRSSSSSSSAAAKRSTRQTNGLNNTRRPLIRSSISEEDTDGPALAEPPRQPQPSTSANTFVTVNSSSKQKLIVSKTTNPGLATLVANGHMWSPPRTRRSTKRLASSSDDEDSGPAQASTADSGASTGAAEPEPSEKEESQDSSNSDSEIDDEEAGVNSSELGVDDEEYQQSEDSEDEQPRRKRTRNRGSSDSEDSYSPVKKSARRKPVKKRPVPQGRTRRKRPKVSYQEEESEDDVPTRTRRTRTKKCVVEDSDEESSDHAKKVISISSRGRVRKITERARGLFGD